MQKANTSSSNVARNSQVQSGEVAESVRHQLSQREGISENQERLRFAGMVRQSGDAQSTVLRLDLGAVSTTTSRPAHSRRGNVDRQGGTTMTPESVNSVLRRAHDRGVDVLHIGGGDDESFRLIRRSSRDSLVPSGHQEISYDEELERLGTSSINEILATLGEEVTLEELRGALNLYTQEVNALTTSNSVSHAIVASSSRAQFLPHANRQLRDLNAVGATFFRLIAQRLYGIQVVGDGAVSSFGTDGVRQLRNITAILEDLIEGRIRDSEVQNVYLDRHSLTPYHGQQYGVTVEQVWDFIRERSGLMSADLPALNNMLSGHRGESSIFVATLFSVLHENANGGEELRQFLRKIDENIRTQAALNDNREWIGNALVQLGYQGVLGIMGQAVGDAYRMLEDPINYENGLYSPEQRRVASRQFIVDGGFSMNVQIIFNSLTAIGFLPNNAEQRRITAEQIATNVTKEVLQLGRSVDSKRLQQCIAKAYKTQIALVVGQRGRNATASQSAVCQEDTQSSAMDRKKDGGGLSRILSLFDKKSRGGGRPL